MGHKAVYMYYQNMLCSVSNLFSLLFALEQNVLFFRFETSGSKAIGL